MASPFTDKCNKHAYPSSAFYKVVNMLDILLLAYTNLFKLKFHAGSNPIDNTSLVPE